MRLYELSDDYTALYDQLDDLDLDTEEGRQLFEAFADTIEGIEGEFEEKAEKIACFIKELSGDAALIKAEKAALDKRMKQKAEKADWLKRYLLYCMEQTGKAKIDRPLASISLRNTAEKPIFDNETVFIKWAEANGMDDLLRFKDPEINRDAVKQALKDGLVVSGVTLERGKSVVIK